MGVLRPADAMVPVHPVEAARWGARPRVAAVRGAAVAVFASRQSVPAPTLSACAGLEVRPVPVPAEVAPAAARELGAVLGAGTGGLRPADAMGPVHPVEAGRWWARPRVAAVRGAAVAVFASRQSAPAPTLSACAGLEGRPAPVPAEVAAVAPG